MRQQKFSVPPKANFSTSLFDRYNDKFLGKATFKSLSERINFRDIGI